MLTALAWLSLAQVVSPTDAHRPEPVLLASEPGTAVTEVARRPGEVFHPQEVRPLPGQLNQVPVFNSNSPELVQRDGILLSTFPKEGMASPDAHLNFPFEGRFDIFAHHIARGLDPQDRRTLFIGVVLYNPTSEPITLDIFQGVSYLSQEAPFRNLPSYVANPNGSVYSGPGSRTVTDMLQGKHQSQWPSQVTVPPRQAYLLMNAPIPLRQLSGSADATLPPGSVLSSAPSSGVDETLVASTDPAAIANNVTVGAVRLPSNGRSAMLYLSSSGPVYAASLAMYAPRDNSGRERAPTLQEWLTLLVNGDLSGPRDIPPTDPEKFDKNNEQERFFYGRVAGVARGSQWTSFVTDTPGGTELTIPKSGEAYSYVISTVDYNTFGTNQIQSAPMLVRYPDTAYRAHGNYGVRYQISLPFYNPTDATQQVVLKLQTPLQDETLRTGLRFSQRPEDRIFFRGTVRLGFSTNIGVQRSRYVHIVQRQGQAGEPLLQVSIPPRGRRLVEVDFIYPPDATPPQVLTISTLENPALIEASASVPTTP